MSKFQVSMPKFSKLGRVGDTKIARHASNEMFRYAAKCQGYNFYRFWVIKGEPTGGEGLNYHLWFIYMKQVSHLDRQICTLPT